MKEKAYIVAVDMGYGHQRAAYPLQQYAEKIEGVSEENGVINANSYPSIPASDRNKWDSSRKVYEFISRFKNVPILGKWLFELMDYFQKIDPFYPKRDLSKPSFQLKQIYQMIGKGWGRDLIMKLNENPLPLITTFFIPAFFAEEFHYQGPIYCICTDSDVSRAWVPLNPKTSNIQYLVPTRRVKQRLMSYGVLEKNLFLTGFPLPLENLGGAEKELARQDIGCRIGNLDPENIYQTKYESHLKNYLGSPYCEISHQHPLTITFCVGGAGAQSEIAVSIVKSLKSHLEKKTIHLNLIAGTHLNVKEFFFDLLKEHNLERNINQSITILYEESKDKYFKAFNELLHTTDILWTKPSELSFYAGLGIPIIMCPPLGSQEDFNRKWLLSIGAGFDQEDPSYVHEWLFDWLQSGWFAGSAMRGFLDAPHSGTYHIANIVFHGKKEDIEDFHLL